ncbi:MAG: glycosyltransferase family A protein [Pseudomonadota bacterium]
MTQSPWLSVVVPVRDSTHLTEALSSIATQPNSDGIEVIVVDGGSRSDIQALELEGWPRVVFVERGDGSASLAVKVGLDAASASFVTFLDPSDRYAPAALGTLRRGLEAAPGVAAAQGTIRRRQGKEALGPSHLDSNVGAMMIKREALVALDLVNPSRPIDEDGNLVAQLGRAGLAVLPLAETIIHSRSSSEAPAERLYQNQVDGQPIDDTLTVALVVRNGMPHLPDAVASLRGQIHSPDRIIAVVGASEDETAEWLTTQPDIEVLSQHGTGLAEARNQAVAAVDEGWLAFLDHDDLWAAEKLADQRRVAAMVQELSAVVCRFETDGHEGQASGARIGWTPSALMAHRVTFDEIGPFDASLGLGCDTDWFRRLRLSDTLCLLPPRMLMTKRRHGGNLSAEPFQNRHAMFAMIAKHRRTATRP